MILTRESLDKLQCANPSCDHDGCQLWFHARCHPETPSWAIYDKRTGTLRFQCSVCREVVAVIAVAADPAEPVVADGSDNPVYRARDLLIAYMEQHQQECPNRQCGERGNVLAFLAHSIGAQRRDVAAFPRLLVDYDLHCQRKGGCPTHPNRIGTSGPPPAAEAAGEEPFGFGL